jgi:DNA-binding CsgD family transcriptional regulator
MRETSGNLLLVTKREKEVLRLIAEGLTNADIAERLFISLPTVNTHRKSLLEKLEAKNTALLISKAVKLGLV